MTYYRIIKDDNETDWVCENCEAENEFEVIDMSINTYGDKVCEICGCRK